MEKSNIYHVKNLFFHLLLTLPTLSLSSQNNFKTKQLFQACLQGNSYTVAALCHDKSLEKADLNAIDSTGYTPLHFACDHESPDIAELLLKNGAIIKKTNNPVGETPLHVACRRENSDVAALLFNFITPEIVNTPDKWGLTALHIASRFERADTVALLINHNADVSIKDMYQQTAFMYACDTRNLPIINLLLNKGANPHEFELETFATPSPMEAIIMGTQDDTEIMDTILKAKQKSQQRS